VPLSDQVHLCLHGGWYNKNLKKCYSFLWLFPSPTRYPGLRLLTREDTDSMSPWISASPVRGNRDESEALPFTCCSQGTLPRLRESRLFARGHPPPMCPGASRSAGTPTEDAGLSRPPSPDRSRGRGSQRRGRSAPRRDPPGREARGPRADDPALDRHGRLAVAALRPRGDAVLRAVGRRTLAPDRGLAARCPFPPEALASGGTTGSPP
jgi:hypothetical protein